jgi:hypothetical protein
VREVLELRDFLDFSSALEALHDRVHVWVGGHMGLIPFAAFDPIFWAHHDGGPTRAYLAAPPTLAPGPREQSWTRHCRPSG